MEKSLLILLLVCATITLVNSLVCPKDPCKFVKCEDHGVCDGPNQELRNGGFCNCCKLCITLLDEGDPCFISPIREVVQTKLCKEGLECYQRKCIKRDEYINILRNKHLPN
ncbi:fungal protease inhibitor-1 [Aethina tumida]|uniref:fungal protease inhibitor-1 n=1 Tax=Aethina tumida TaxID=116153 RepID=UPI0021476FBC|nr:fungal protease inhibitor-1 [Aethina tumida]